MRRGTWRDQAVPLVAEAIRAARDVGLEGAALVRYCNRQFPWGVRQHHPYRIWMSEVKRQLGVRRRKDDPLPLFDGGTEA